MESGKKKRIRNRVRKDSDSVGWRSSRFQGGSTTYSEKQKTFDPLRPSSSHRSHETSWKARKRARHLRWVVNEIGKRKKELGEDAVELGWVKAHVWIYGNEKADGLAKKGAEKTPNKTWITEGGLKQAWVKKRNAERCVKGTGMGRVLKWNRKALLNYTQCRTGKGRLGWWRYTLDPWEDPTCGECHNLETGRHVALVCTAGE